MKKDLVKINPHIIEGYSFNWEKAFKYAKLMEQGEEFPPVRLHLKKDNTFVLKNGMHRIIASRLCGKDLILAEIATYEYDDEDFFEDLDSNYKIR